MSKLHDPMVVVTLGCLEDEGVADYNVYEVTGKGDNLALHEIALAETLQAAEQDATAYIKGYRSGYQEGRAHS